MLEPDLDKDLGLDCSVSNVILLLRTVLVLGLENKLALVDAEL